MKVLQGFRGQGFRVQGFRVQGFRAGSIGLVVLGAAALTACSSSTHTHHSGMSGMQGMSGMSSAAGTTALAGTGSGRVGAISITDAYIPKPASPEVAAAYLLIRNDGTVADRIVSVSTTGARSVMAMTETDRDGAGSMTALPQVVVAAHGSFAFTPGHNHFMLENPTRPLAQGDTVILTITFAHAGTLALKVPVVPITGPAGMSSMPSMSGSMSSMHMVG